MAGLQPRVLAPDAEILAGSYRDAARARREKELAIELQNQRQAGALQQMIAQVNLQNDLRTQDEARRGEESLGAINEFLRTNRPVADRLGRIQQAPMPEGVAGPGSPQFQPYAVKGRGAGTLADFLQKEIGNISAENRAQIAAEAADKRLVTLMQGRKDIVNTQEGGKNERASLIQDRTDDRLAVTEKGKNDRFSKGEAGKNARTNTMASALQGETTFRTQVGSMDDYIKTLSAQRTQLMMEDLISKAELRKNPADPAAQARVQRAGQALQALDEELAAAQQQYKGSLQPRTPSITKPAPKAAPVPKQIEDWKMIDGKLQRVK